MAKKPSSPRTTPRSAKGLETRHKPQQIIDYSVVAQTGPMNVEWYKLQEIVSLLWLPASLPEEERALKKHVSQLIRDGRKTIEQI